MRSELIFLSDDVGAQARALCSPKTGLVVFAHMLDTTVPLKAACHRTKGQELVDSCLSQSASFLEALFSLFRKIAFILAAQA